MLLPPSFRPVTALHHEQTLTKTPATQDLRYEARSLTVDSRKASGGRGPPGRLLKRNGSVGQRGDGRQPRGRARAVGARAHAHPLARQQSEPALLYARALGVIGAPGTRAAFEIALASARDAAPRCLYADWLAVQPDEADRQRARELYAEIVQDARHWPRHAREHNSEWLQRAQAALSR